MIIWIAEELPLFNFERLDILCAWIGHPSEKLWPFEFLESFHCSISRVSIYCWPYSYIWVKSYGRLNLACASMLKFEHLDILCDCIDHMSEKILPFDSLESSHFSISSVSIYYWPESDIRVTSYDRLNLSCASMFNFEHLDIICTLIGHSREKLSSFEFLLFACSQRGKGNP